MRPQSTPAMSTEELIKNRFNFHMALIKSYIEYSHRVGGKSKKEMIDNVDKIANDLTEKYHFGQTFFTEIRQYINDCYGYNKQRLVDDIKRDSGLSDVAFESMVDSFKSYSDTNLFDANFTNMFE